MPKITNPVIINKIREGLLEGKPDNKILIDAGLSEKTANHKAYRCKVLEVVKSCIRKELKESDITVELIISNLNEDRELARKKKDIATMRECDVWLGKYLAMFTDKIKSDDTISPTYIINTIQTKDNKEIKNVDKDVNKLVEK